MKIIRKILCWFNFHMVEDDGQENSPQYLRCIKCGKIVKKYRGE